MKKLFGIAAAVALAMAIPAAAEEEIPLYQQLFPNESTFETLEEAHENAPEALNALTGLTYQADAALDTYSQGTTFVYRSAGTYTSLSAAFRMNTNILVYTDQAFETKEDAQAYLQSLGVTDIVDQMHGSAVLVTPINCETGFGSADQYDYLKLQSAMCNLGAAQSSEEGTTYIADNTYFGGLTYRYAIGIDGGADFLCNYVANTLDYAGRLGGMLLINPTMDARLDAACAVPVYLVNPDENVVAAFNEANRTNVVEETADEFAYYDEAHPVRRTVVAKDDEKELAEYVKAANEELFLTSMRTPVVKSGMYVAASEFADYSWNQAPYALTERSGIVDGVTVDGIVVTEHQEDRFADMKADNGEYLRTWYEFLPEEVVDGTAEEHSIPLILCNHGGGDDPVQAADELGLIALAGEERIAMVAPRYATDVPGATIFDGSPFNINEQTLPALVQYMLDTYPALDPSRVYATGYSMGGAATVEAVEAAPQLFAACAPMAAGTPWGITPVTDEQAEVFKDVDVAMMLTTSEFDLSSAIDSANGTIGDGYKDCFRQFAGFNEIDLPDYDFEAYPFVGFEADCIVTKTLNDEYENTRWFKNNADGVPVMAVSYTELLPHGLYPEYGKLAWDYFKHFSRNTETGELVYTE